MPRNSAMKKQWKKMSVEEVRLARAWYENDNFKPSKIAGLLGRAKSTQQRVATSRKAAVGDARPDRVREGLDCSQ
jgi:hypothetical protein